jgi:hypothetical protein
MEHYSVSPDLPESSVRSTRLYLQVIPPSENDSVKDHILFTQFLLILVRSWHHHSCPYILPDLSKLISEAAGSSETSLPVYQTTRGSIGVVV